jgi:heme-degrading monooxygenase HmoA
VYTRQLTIKGAEDIDAGLAYLRAFVPVFSEQHGFRGVSVSADRDGGIFGVTSQWASEEALEKSECVLSEARSECHKVTGGEMTVEKFELTTDAIARVPVPGNPVLVARVSMDPACIDGQISRFEREILPAIAAQRGFSCLRLMANRREGRCVLGTVWQNAHALARYMDSMVEQRDFALMLGVQIDEISPREILLIEVD